jgi:hypothetical protein
MKRACVKDAGKIIIHAGTDYESVSIALAVKEINQSAPIVVKADDPGKEVDIERVDRNRVVCIKAVDVPMIVREIHNPGMASRRCSKNSCLRKGRTCGVFKCPPAIISLLLDCLRIISVSSMGPSSLVCGPRETH